MIINVSFHSKETNRKINDLVGKSYGLFSKERWSGIGSPRLTINSCSKRIADIFRVGNSTPYCNIELRPKGIIVWLRNGQESTNWVIPFYRLTLFQNGNSYSIHSEGALIKITSSYHKQNISRFVNKLVTQKANFSNQYQKI